MIAVVSGNTLAEVSAAHRGCCARQHAVGANGWASPDGRRAGAPCRRDGADDERASCPLSEAKLVAVEKQGRHRYYRLASPEVAQAIHGLMTVAASGPKRHHPVGPSDEALRVARTCYDHMAGRLALAISRIRSPIRAMWCWRTEPG